MSLPATGTVRGRFAPSPTGRMHLGNARSALLGFLQAKALGGEFLLRIEDLDRARCRAEYVETLLRDLEYLGIGWDGPLVYQSQRSEAYEAALEQLQGSGRVYRCTCTRAEVAQAATAPHGPADDGPRYPGTCRAGLGAPLSAADMDRPWAIRFMPEPGVVALTDALAGPYAQDVDAVVGDFVVRRNDGVASYQLAVVVDDAASGISHVLRGDDLLSSTPRQLLLYRALGLKPPNFAHVPLLLGADGKRIAKREGGWTVAQLRERGVDPRRVLALLAEGCGLGDGEPVTAAELIPRFALEKLAPTPTLIHTAQLAQLLSKRGGP